MFSCIRLFISALTIFFMTASVTVCAAVQDELTKLEAASGGRLGVSAINTANNVQIHYRANERFPMGCTSKVMGVSAMLKLSAKNPELLQEKVLYNKKDVVAWSPITGNYAADGMTIAQLCAAAISYSDNTAMNLIVKKIGGIPAFNHFARSIGDTSFKQDNLWPDEALSGPEGMDSSTPAAMTKSLQKLVLGNALPLSQRTQLQTWLIANTTGNARIRAGVPNGWTVGDKTGTGQYGTTNDIAIIWPPKKQPIVVTIFYTTNKKTAHMREDIIASATRILLKEFAQT